MSWGKYVARLAVRRVVWIVVGLVVFAVLAAVGVKAVEQNVSGGAWSVSAGAARLTALSGGFTPAVGTTIAASMVGATSSNGGSYGIICTGYSSGGAFIPDGGVAYATSPGSWVVPAGAGSCQLASWVFAGESASGTSWSLTYDDGVEPTPTPQALTCDPSCVVELSEYDRERVDLLIFALVTVGGVTAFGVGAIAMGTVLRGR